MNIPASITGDYKPSATIDEALERLVATHNRRIYELEKQREELAACLREIMTGFEQGTLVRNTLDDGRSDFHVRMVAFVRLLSRCQEALLRCDVRARLDDRVAAEQRKQERAT